MNEDREMELERRLSTLEADMKHVRSDAADRLEAIMERFDRIDRRWQGFVAAVFTVCLTFGGIYLEAYFNKDDHYKSLAVVTEQLQ